MKWDPDIVIEEWSSGSSDIVFEEVQDADDKENSIPYEGWGNYFKSGSSHFGLKWIVILDRRKKCLALDLKNSIALEEL